MLIIKIRFEEEPDGVHVYSKVDRDNRTELENSVYERVIKLIDNMVDLDQDCAIGRKNKTDILQRDGYKLAVPHSEDKPNVG